MYSATIYLFIIYFFIKEFKFILSKNILWLELLHFEDFCFILL